MIKNGDDVSFKQNLTLKQINATYDLYQPDVVNKVANHAINDVCLTGYLNKTQLQKELDILASVNSHAHQLSIGIDEAGRGPLLGGVMVAGVLLPSVLSGELTGLSIDAQFIKSPLAGIKDSKKLSEKRRQQYVKAIKNTAIGYVLVDVPAAVIDAINILQASLLGMQLAGDALLKLLANHIHQAIESVQVEILIDGNQLPPLMMHDKSRWQRWLYDEGWQASQIYPQAVIKGDDLYSSISAASILAKVNRDEQMQQLAKRYPNYLIDKHKGYATKTHLLAIAEHGVLPEHRRSFAPINKL